MTGAEAGGGKFHLLFLPPARPRGPAGVPVPQGSQQAGQWVSRSPEEGAGAGSLLFLPLTAPTPQAAQQRQQRGQPRDARMHGQGLAQSCRQPALQETPGRALPPGQTLPVAPSATPGAQPALAAHRGSPQINTEQSELPDTQTVPQQPPALPRGPRYCFFVRQEGKAGLCLVPWEAAPGTFLGTGISHPWLRCCWSPQESSGGDARAQFVLAPARNHSQEGTGMWPHLEEESRAGLG